MDRPTSAFSYESCRHRAHQKSPYGSSSALRPPRPGHRPRKDHIRLARLVAFFVMPWRVRRRRRPTCSSETGVEVGAEFNLLSLSSLMYWRTAPRRHGAYHLHHGAFRGSCRRSTWHRLIHVHAAMRTVVHRIAMRKLCSCPACRGPFAAVEIADPFHALER